MEGANTVKNAGFELRTVVTAAWDKLWRKLLDEPRVHGGRGPAFTQRQTEDATLEHAYTA
jgi:hypothetical protein